MKNEQLKIYSVKNKKNIVTLLNTVDYLYKNRYKHAIENERCHKLIELVEIKNSINSDSADNFIIKEILKKEIEDIENSMSDIDKNIQEKLYNNNKSFNSVDFLNRNILFSNSIKSITVDYDDKQLKKHFIKLSKKYLEYRKKTRNFGKVYILLFMDLDRLYTEMFREFDSSFESDIKKTILEPIPKIKFWDIKSIDFNIRDIKSRFTLYLMEKKRSQYLLVK